MRIPVQPLRGTEAQLLAQASTLEPDELAISTDTGRIYRVLAGVPNTLQALSSVITISETAPVSPGLGLEWLDSSSGILYTYVNDGNSGQWVELASPGISNQGPTGPTGPASPRSVTLINPSVGDKVLLFYTTFSLEISRVQSLVIGTSPSISFEIKYGTDFSLAGSSITGTITCTSSTTGLATSFLPFSVPQNSWVWVNVTGGSGVVNSLHVSLETV